MPDMTMCSGMRLMIVCPKAKECYRCTAKPSDRQTWFMSAPFRGTEGDVECDYFWPVETSLPVPEASESARSTDEKNRSPR